MLEEAIDALGGRTTNVAVRDWILNRYPGTNTGTIQAQITYCTVNHESRVHGPENRKPRSERDARYDLLYRPSRGALERYDPSLHGVWSIVERDDGRLAVACQSDSPDAFTDVEALPTAAAFAAENHLRDYLAQNLETIEQGLQLYADENGILGVEYATPIGRIDILAVDRDGGFVVIELKVGRGPDAVCGQLLRYKAWVSRHLAEGRRTRGVIIAQTVSDKIRYAMSEAKDVTAYEYDLRVTLREAPLS
jgi:RecB family endonuclease NucS